MSLAVKPTPSLSMSLCSDPIRHRISIAEHPPEQEQRFFEALKEQQRKHVENIDRMLSDQTMSLVKAVTQVIDQRWVGQVPHTTRLDSATSAHNGLTSPRRNLLDEVHELEKKEKEQIEGVQDEQHPSAKPLEENNITLPDEKFVDITSTNDVITIASKILPPQEDKHIHKEKSILTLVDEDQCARAKMHLSAMHRFDNMSGMARVRSSLEQLWQSARLFPAIAIDTVMSVIIIVNAIIIGVSADTADWSGWLLVDFILCACFTLEFLVKLKCIGFRAYFCHDTYWSIFELALLLLSIFELIVASAKLRGLPEGSALFRVFRLLRLTKVLRICRLEFAQELVMMINGAIGSLRTLFWSVVMIIAPLYVVALVLRETLGAESGESAEPFSTVTKAFFNLFRCIVAGDCSDSAGRPIFVLVATEHGWMYGVIYAFTLLFMVFGLFNVIVAIYVENTVAEAHSNDLKRKQKRLRDAEMFQQKTLELAMCIFSFKQNNDLTGVLNGEFDLELVSGLEITSNEFDKICEDPNFSNILAELDIARDEQKDLFDTLDVDRGGTLDIDELISGIQKLRGDARKSDVVTIILSIRHLTKMLDHMLDKLVKQDELLRCLHDAVSGNLK